MQRAGVARSRPVAQMLGTRRVAARGRDRGAPRNARAGFAARVAFAYAGVEPSKAVAGRMGRDGGSGGIRPMAQRFFSGSAITRLTAGAGAMPTGSGGR